MSRVFAVLCGIAGSISVGGAYAQNAGQVANGRDVPIIDVYTMGAGAHMFSRFGHAAVCVTDRFSPRGRCYNYGTADFSTPGPLTWRFIRGRAQFWVGVGHLEPMLRFYKKEDRTVWRQRLTLTSTQARQLALGLADSASEAKKYYRYHHFEDNCTTRIRDAVDRVVEAKLSKATKPVSDELSFRDYANRGFAGQAPLQLATDLVLGRYADREITRWDAMFHPDVFRVELERVLGVKPTVIYARKQPVESGAVWLSSGLLVGFGVLGALGIMLWPRGVLYPFVGLTSVVGAALWFLAMVSEFHELRYNEALLALLPIDILFVFTKYRTNYLKVRCSMMGGVLLLAAVGVFVQPAAVSVMMLLVFAAGLYRQLRPKAHS